MKTKRRDFLKLTGAVSLGLVSRAAIGNAAESPTPGPDDVVALNRKYQARHKQRFNMAGYAAPKIGTVRVGIIGMGNRGPGHMNLLRRLDGVEIKALCDLLPERVEAAAKQLENSPHAPALYAGSEHEWKKLCERPDIDLVVVTTPYYLHAPMAIYAMEQGKHAASEVPAAGTMEECWQLVQTAERTRKHLIMLENYSYLPFQLLTLSMARQGFFGEVVHGECAYNTSKMGNNFSKTCYWNMWWLRQYAARRGNIYPTHGLGPVCQIMNINRGDQLDFLVSVESRDFMMAKKAAELAQADSFYAEFANKDYRGNMNTTLIRTVQGRTIMLQHDATSPSPHNLIHGIYGTEGSALFDPPPPRLAAGNHEWVSVDEFETLKKKYAPTLSKRMGGLASTSGHWGSDLLIMWRLIDCLHHGLPLDQDVYDAASWSSLIPLSQWSVLNRSLPVSIPDFTFGAWKNNPQNMDIEFNHGGATTKVIA